MAAGVRHGQHEPVPPAGPPGWIELVGPVRPDTSWQAKAGEGYDISAFSIDWDTQGTVTLLD